MSNTVIKVENISKQYRLGNVGLGTLSHDINRWYQTTIRRREDPYLKIGETNDRAVKGESEYVWALRDINFEVQQGEVLGIIGRNGAGKSTLLKILSRTTTPTTGQIKIKGRVASLLEVGTGFHPELTGRENIFLNGAILGMTRKEIKDKFDEIVDFAGVERYIDTPVKRYSSGMYVRLAFGVAAHLEPEILIVDEVLAVGDAEFQKKALGKMKDVSSKQGRTVLFVSHNMAAVSTLTQKCALLVNGKLKSFGETSDILQAYFKNNSSFGKEYVNNNLSETSPVITAVSIHTSHADNIQAVYEPMSIRFEIYSPVSVKDAAISYQVFNSNNEPVLHVLNLSTENVFCEKPGKYLLESVIPKVHLYPDDYYLVVHFADNATKTKYQKIEAICQFEVKVFGELRDYYWYKKHAIYLEDTHWTVNLVN